MLEDKDREARLEGAEGEVRYTPIRNPLPVPRKRQHMPLEFEIEPVRDGVQDEFDLEPQPGDDFDI